ncbi:MAG: cyanophycinase, partial [Dokdonella sp.]
MPARIAPDATRGLIIVGGDLDAGERGVAMLSRLLSRCGDQGRVLILETTTDDDEVFDLEAALLKGGAIEVRAHTISTRSDAAVQALADRLDQVDLLLIAPCAPLRLTSLIGGTALARALRRRNADGMAVAAFGAAAAAISEHMLATGTEGLTPRSGGVSLAPGLGLSNRVLIDQGGQATDRLGRLLAALALNPFALGLGIDAGTAAMIGPDN